MLENLRPSPRAIPGLWSSVDSSHSKKTLVISSDSKTEGIDLGNSYIGSDYSSEAMMTVMPVLVSCDTPQSRVRECRDNSVTM